MSRRRVIIFCDSSDEMIRIAKEHFEHRNAEFSVCEIQKLAYADEFNVITAIQVNHIKRYGKDYFPISLSENMELMRNCGFKVVEILWLSNMQVGLWGMK